MINLIRYQPEFLESFIEWRGQPASIRHNPLRVTTSTQIAEMLESEGADLSDLEKYENYRWFIDCDGVVVGSVSLKNISQMMNYGEIGYSVAEAWHGRGIATGAVRLLIDRIFLETDLRKIMAYVHDKNTASCRVLEKLGFSREGLLREHYIINGQPENELVFGLLKREWARGV